MKVSYCERLWILEGDEWKCRGALCLVYDREELEAALQKVDVEALKALKSKILIDYDWRFRTLVVDCNDGILDLCRTFTNGWRFGYNKALLDALRVLYKIEVRECCDTDIMSEVPPDSIITDIAIVRQYS